MGLVWNGMMSFGGSWFFLTASEQISVLKKNYTLPGIGSYVGVASFHGQLVDVLLAMLTMVVMVLLVNFVFWRPLTAYVERFRVEQSEATDKQQSLVLNALRHSHWPALLGPGPPFGGAAGESAHGRARRDRRPLAHRP